MTVATAYRTHQLLIGGEWVPAAAGGTMTIPSPVTGEPAAVVAAAEAADVDRAVAAASAAFEANRWRSPFDRAAEAERIADVLERRADELADAIVLEHGKPHAEAVGEVYSAAAGFRLAAGEARRLTGETLPVADPHKRVMTFRQPRGVVAAMTPWNFPMNIPVEYVGPALASGNAVILKPAPTTAGIAALLAQCIVEADLPPGLFSLLTGPSVEMSKALVSHPGVAVVGFTGSSAAGEAIARAAGGKELVMELGGNGPVIVLDDADLARAVPVIARPRSSTPARRALPPSGSWSRTQSTTSWLTRSSPTLPRCSSATRVRLRPPWALSTTRASQPRWTSTSATPLPVAVAWWPADTGWTTGRRASTTSRPCWRRCPWMRSCTTRRRSGRSRP